MKAIRMPVDDKCEVVDVSFQELREGVGGDVELVKTFRPVMDAVCNEDGRALGLKHNRRASLLFFGMDFVGTVYLTGVDLTDLDNQVVERFPKSFM